MLKKIPVKCLQSGAHSAEDEESAIARMNRTEHIWYQLRVIITYNYSLMMFRWEITELGGND